MPNPIKQIIRAGMAATLPRRLFMVSGPAGAPDVCLTFDDGPHPVHTPALLDVLAAAGVKATFFMIGQEVEKHPQVVRRVAAEGHAIGGHSFTHSNPSTTPARQLAEEVERTRRLLEQTIGEDVRLFRPPHGKLTAAKARRLWRAGQSIVLWNVDPKDFACRSSGELAAKLDARRLSGGDVVLLHDNLPVAAEALPDVIGGARQGGVGFATVADWLGHSRGGRGATAAPPLARE